MQFTSSRQPKRCKDSGMTLVEVIIASAVFAFVIISSMSATSQAMLLTEVAIDRGRAVEWIQSEIEYIRDLSWTNVESIPNSGEFLLPSPEEKYIGSRLIQNRNSNQKIIRLVVMWNDSRGQFHTSSMVTIVNRYGI